MQTIKSDMIVFSDVDDTLVIWNNIEWWKPGPDQIEIHDPTDDTFVFLKPHHPHIALLKKYKAQGYTVIVWSAGGYRWAESVVKTLKLENTVDLVMSKPLKYVDDLQAKDILGTRVYIQPGLSNRNIESGEQE